MAAIKILIYVLLTFLGAAIVASAFNDLVRILKYDLEISRGFTALQIMEWFRSSTIFMYAMPKTSPEVIIDLAFEKAGASKAEFNRSHEGCPYYYINDNGEERMFIFKNGEGKPVKKVKVERRTI